MADLGLGASSGPNPQRAVGVPAPGEYWTPVRLGIDEWLKRNAPSLAELYEGAVELICRRNVPGWTRLACHAIREVGNELPDVITGTRSGMLQHTTRMDQLVAVWKKNTLPLDASLPGVQMTGGESRPTPTFVQVPLPVYVGIAEFVRDHDRSRNTREDAAVAFLKALLPEEATRPETLLIIRQWRKSVKWFVDHAHDKRILDSEIDATELSRQFDVFEGTLASLVRQFFTTSKDIDDILKDANS